MFNLKPSDETYNKSKVLEAVPEVEELRIPRKESVKGEFVIKKQWEMRMVAYNGSPLKLFYNAIKIPLAFACLIRIEGNFESSANFFRYFKISPYDFVRLWRNGLIGLEKTWTCPRMSKRGTNWAHIRKFEGMGKLSHFIDERKDYI